MKHPDIQQQNRTRTSGFDATQLAWEASVRGFFQRWETLAGSPAADMYELRFARVCRRYLAAGAANQSAERRQALRSLQKLNAEMTLAIAFPLEVAA